METKNLKINCVESKLDKLTLYEPIDIKILDKLINSDLLKVEFHNPLCKGYENEKQLLLSYKKLIKNGKAEVKYNKAKGIKYGRVNPHKALGLFSIRREIRHTLAKGTFVDIDIENCHPVILLQLCEANNIETKYLKKYVNKRQHYLDQVINYYGVSRDDAKRLFIRLLYFGKFECWLKEIQEPKQTEKLNFIHNFSLELNNIGHQICEANPELKKEVSKRKDDDYNLVGSVVSYFLQEYENRILEAVFFYCVDNRYIINNVAVLCADGMMIEEKYYKESLLSELVDLVDKQFGFKVKFTTKEFNQDYLNILDDHQIKGAVELPKTDRDNIKIGLDGSHKDIALLIKSEFTKAFVCTGKVFYTFNENNTLWESVNENYITSKITYLLQNIIDEEIQPYKDIDFFQLSDNEKIDHQIIMNEYKTVNRKIGDPTHCAKFFKYLSNTVMDPNFEEKLNRTEDYLLPVKNNKCIDLENGLLVDRVKEHYFDFEIDIDYNPDDEIDKAYNFFKSVMNNDEAVLKYFQKVLGSFLCSQVEAQSIYIWWGTGSNGKSASISLIQKVLNKFCATVHKGLFVQTKNKNNLGASPEKLVLKNIRLALISEIDENEKLNEDLLKNISGDDKLTARGLFKDPVEFKPKLSPVILTNNKPLFDVSSDAMLRRVKLIPFKAKFKEQPDISKGEQKVDKYLVKQLNEKYINQVLKFMVLGAIEFIKDSDMTLPKELNEDFNNYLKEINPAKSFMEDKFLISKDEKDRILRGTMYEIYKKWAVDNGLTIFIKKSDFYKTIDKELGESKKITGNYYYTKIIEIKDQTEEELEDHLENITLDI